MAETNRRRIKLKDGRIGTIVLGDTEGNTFVPDNGQSKKIDRSPFNLMDKASESISNAAFATASGLTGPFGASAKLAGIGQAGVRGLQKLPEGFVEPVSQATGSIAGGAIGGFPGAIAGGTIGAIGGRGELLRRRKESGEDISQGRALSEIGMSGGAAAATETAFPFVGKGIAAATKPARDFVFKKVTQPFIENLFNVLTGINKESTKRVLTRGPSNILTRQLRNREAGVELSKNFLSAAKEATREVNKKWVAVVEPLRSNPSNVVDSKIILDGAEDVIRNFDLRAPGGGIREPFLGKAGNDAFKKVRKVYEAIVNKASAGNITLDDALRARGEIDNLIFTGRSQGLFTPKQVAALKELRTAFKDSIHSAYDEIAEVDTARFQLGQAFKAIEKFGTENVKDVSRLGKMIDAFEDIDPAVRETIIQADSVIARETGKSFLDAIRDRSAAKAFEPTELRASRTFIITVVLAGLGLESIVQSGALKGMIGLTGATASIPRGAGALLKVAPAAKSVITSSAASAPVRSAASESIRKRFIKPDEDNQSQ